MRLIMNFLPYIKLQIAELCFTLLVLFDFLRRKRIKLTTTKWFRCIILIIIAYLLFDISTIAAILYAKGTFLCDVFHKIFYILLLSSVFSFSIYVELAGNKATKWCKTLVLLCVGWFTPYILCFIGIIVTKPVYIFDFYGAYSDGKPVTIMSLGLIFYLLIILIGTFRYKNVLSKQKINALRMQVFIWTIALFYQRFINRYMLISGLALTLGLMLLYFSFENPSVFLNENTDTYNEKGFNLFFYEACNCVSSKPFYLATVIIDDMDSIASSILDNQLEEFHKELCYRIKLVSQQHLYIMNKNVILFTMPINKKDELIERSGHIRDILATPFYLSDTSITIKSHMVIFECPKQVHLPEEVRELVQFDVSSANQYVYFASEDFIGKRERKMILLKMIRDAIENDGFDVFYQPIYSTKNGSFISSEALVRLKDTSTLGFVSPEEFIPIAENNSLISQIGELVFTKVCDSIIELRNKGIRIDYIEVNLSTLQIINDKVTERFLQIMEQRGLSPSSLNLEITETAAVECAKLLEKNMSTFRDAGCTFSMDDFGTGYSNLSNMADIPYEIVKLDKSLIWPCFKGNEKAKTMLKSIITMLKNLDIHIVAEGVETQEMVDFLTENGVDYLQGYFYSKPISKNQYIEFLNKA